MDLVIAIKPEPSRVVKKTAANRVTVLLSDVRSSGDKTIVHRDNAYLNRLEGTCFKCTKLTEIPPVDVCERPTLVPPEQFSCIELNDYCECYNCPTEPAVYNCYGQVSLQASPQGYPVPSQLEDAGSGYWVGLQANNFYSNPLNGGWVVAVECSSGYIVGTFPVSQSNFGYGVGSILGYSVMIYPAGVVYGTGARPANKTTFPILAQNIADGDELLSTGFSLTGPNQSLGTPYDDDSETLFDPSTTYAYFCNTGPAQEGFNPLEPRIGMFTIDQPKSCLQKYGNSSCSEFNNFSGVQTPYTFDKLTSSYFLDVRNSTYFNQSESLPSNAVISFTRSDGSKYCSAVEGITQFENYAFDALDGVCSNLIPEWPDTPKCAFDNCASCVGDSDPDCGYCVPCQYVNNLTMGEFNGSNGGYNAASGIDSAYSAIGPSNPPTIEGNTISNSYFWETYWDWNPEKHFIQFLNEDKQTTSIGLIPPISSLMNSCCCSENTSAWFGVLYIESINSDGCGDDETSPTCTGSRDSLTGLAITKAGRSCSPYCTPCPRNDMLGTEAMKGLTLLGRAGDYGKISCCSAFDEGEESPFNNSTVTRSIGTNIWWLNSLSQGPIGYGITDTSPISLLESSPPPESVPGSGAVGSCVRGIPTSSSTNIQGPADDPCNNIFAFSEATQKYEFDSNAFEECTGYKDINSDCFKSSYLPLRFKDIILEFKDEIDDNFFADNVGFKSDPDREFVSLRDSICDGDPNCSQLRYLNGPLASFDKGTSIGQFIRCGIPCDSVYSYVPKSEDPDEGCPSELVEDKRLIFKRPICNQQEYGAYCCDINATTDPCACCGVNGFGMDGGIQCATSPSSQGACPPCCTAGGCQDNGVCGENSPQFIPGSCAPTGGGNPI